jgi:hypothetical protein
MVIPAGRMIMALLAPYWGLGSGWQGLGPIIMGRLVAQIRMDRRGAAASHQARSLLLPCLPRCHYCREERRCHWPAAIYPKIKLIRIFRQCTKTRCACSGCRTRVCWPDVAYRATLALEATPSTSNNSSVSRMPIIGRRYRANHFRRSAALARTDAWMCCSRL